MGTFIEIISTPTSYSVEDDTDDKAVWSPVESSLDVTAYETIDIEVAVYALTLSATLYFMTATTNAGDKSLWSEVDNQGIVNGPSGTEDAAYIYRKTIGATANQPLLRYLRWRLTGSSSGTAKVLVTVRGIGRAG
ncbi:MAG: hypothetical protein R3A52_26490 [Polyangiales bacterium]